MHKLSQWFRHLFHVVSNVRPLVWISGYIIIIPVFALLYWALPSGQFRIPDGGGSDIGSWLYYSIVTITTLGFGDYTPAHGWAQCLTAIEVGSGMLLIGFFLNAVGSMKSEVDVSAEVEKQRILHQKQQEEKLQHIIPGIMYLLKGFIASASQLEITPPANDIHQIQQSVFKSAFKLSLALDSLQGRVDLDLWPAIMEDCFEFVASFQILEATDLAQDSFQGLSLREFANKGSEIAMRLLDSLNKQKVATI